MTLAEVYLAHDTRLNRQVALKVIAAEPLRSPASRCTTGIHSLAPTMAVIWV